jgi:L-methionine (R)-S-oxide reductase
MSANVALETWLRTFLGAHAGVAGTVHVRDGDMLLLRAAVNIPPPVVRATERIPKGKGMAGLAWERNQPVSTCDLKSDASGDVRPGAKAVNAGAAVAIPVASVDLQGGADVRAVVGIAFSGERDFSDEDLRAFEAAARALPVEA